MKILDSFLILFCLHIIKIKCVLIKIEFKLVKNSSNDTDLGHVIDYFTRLKKTTEVDPLQNATIDSFLFWNKFIELESLGEKNQTREDQVLNQLIEISPFRDLIENLKLKNESSTIQDFYTKIDEPTSTPIANLNFESLNATMELFNSTWFQDFNISSNYSQLITSTPFISTSSSFLWTTAPTEEIQKLNVSIKQDKKIESTKITTRKNTTNYIKSKYNTSTYFYSTTTFTTTKIMDILEIMPMSSKILTTITNTFKPKKSTISPTKTLAKQENFECSSNFCLNFGTCYLNYAQEATCKCLDYQLMYHNLIVYYYSGKNCEKISYSLTYSGLFFAIIFTISCVLTLFLFVSCVKTFSGKMVQVKKNSKSVNKNEIFDNTKNDREDNKFSHDFKSNAKNSWKYLKMNYDLGRKNPKQNKNHHIYIKKKIKYKIGSRTFNKYLDKYSSNLFKSVENLMNIDTLDVDENFIFVKRNLSQPSPTNFPSAPSLSKDLFSLSMKNLDALCSSNVNIYPKPSRNLNGKFPPNHDEKEATFMNGAIFY